MIDSKSLLELTKVDQHFAEAEEQPINSKGLIITRKDRSRGLEVFVRGHFSRAAALIDNPAWRSFRGETIWGTSQWQSANAHGSSYRGSTTMPCEKALSIRSLRLVKFI